MKRLQLYRIALLALMPAFVLTSCRFEDDDYFNESPALRIEHQGEAVSDLLVGAPNGWVMQFFCAADVAQFEGFNLFARFDENKKVTMASDHRYLRDGNAGKYTEATSVYEILYEDGLVLGFNVWNDVLTPFTDPVAYWAAPKNIIKDGVGMHGDHNFVVMSYNDNEIILRGERHQAEVRLVKCDRDWQTYLADTKAMKEQITCVDIRQYYVKTGSETLYIEIDPNLYGKFRYCDDLDVKKAVKQDSIACVFTPNGMRFEHKESIGTQGFQEIHLSTDKESLVNEDGSVQVVPCWDKELVSREAYWPMETESLNSELKALWDVIDEELTKKNKNHSLKAVGLGNSGNANNQTGLVVEWYTNTRKTSSNKGSLALIRTNPSYGQMAIDCDPNALVDNNLNNRGDAVIQAVRDFAEKLKGTYDMKPENYFCPSPTDFKQVDGINTFKLKK